MSALHYVEDSTFIQVKPPQWSRNFTGEFDTCTVTYQGAQYRAKAFMDSLAAYATMTCTDEAGANLNDSSMFLTSWTSDDNPVLPSVTLTYMGMRGGVGRGQWRDLPGGNRNRSVGPHRLAARHQRSVHARTRQRDGDQYANA